MPIHNQQQTIAAFPLSGKTMADALHWHQTELAKLGIAADQFAFLDYPDDFPDHSLAQGAAFGGGNGADHQAIAQYFAITQPYLQQIVAAHPGASPVHIWPHHFDMAILITLSGAGEEAKTVGVGLSPGDGSYSQPYWYVTPWPYPPQDDLPALTAGIWHREGWIGAILLAEAVPELTSDIAQKTLKGFLDEAVSACCVLLT